MQVRTARHDGADGGNDSVRRLHESIYYNYSEHSILYTLLDDI